MARKSYSDEFKGDAVALYRDTEGESINMIAAELDVSESTLSAWSKARGCADPAPRGHVHGEPAPGVETPEQEVARLRAENRELRADKTRLSTERDILWSAAKYFAGETNW
jgi:transposase